MNCKRASEYLMHHLQADPGESRHPELLEHLEGCASCRREAEELGEMWGLLGKLEPSTGDEAMRSRFYAMLATHATGEPARRSAGLFDWLEGWWPHRPLQQAVLTAGVLVLGLLLGSRVGSGSSRPDELRELRAEVQTMTQAVALTLLQHESASERLRAVGLSEELRRDGEIARALVDTVNNDSNINVRLAALDVLAEMVSRPEVRAGLVDSMPRQDSAMMQVALADVLAAMNGPASSSAIRKALDRPEMLAPVRRHLEQKLSKREDRI